MRCGRIPRRESRREAGLSKLNSVPLQTIEVDIASRRAGSPEPRRNRRAVAWQLRSRRLRSLSSVFPRKEVIQPQLPLRLPCYDFTPIINPTFDGSLPQGVRPPASGVADFRDVTGGVYKARERIHRDVADSRLLATPTSWGRVADPNPN